MLIFAQGVTHPLSNPVQIFLLALVLLLFAPLLAKRLRLPGIIGLIAAGVVVGPHGLNWLQKSGGIELLSTTGMLYIMFLAGLEIDFNDFKKNYRNSLLFGALTFIFPITIGISLAYYWLGFEFYAALLLGSMVGTHTLVSYPIVRRLGISRTEVVATAAGGTFITDTAVLLFVAVVVAAHKGELSALFWLKLCTSIALFGLAIIGIFPLLSRWFLRYIALDDTTQYIFILTMVFLAGFLAQLAGLEPIIGSFLAGFVFNRLIPHRSVLMDKIIFGGNIFIPFFLLSVGMIVNLNGLFEGSKALFIILAIIFSSQMGKWLAAFSTQKLLKYDVKQRNLLFGLSNAHAAAAIAVILVGYQQKLLGEEAINSAVLLIPVSCLISTLVAEHYGRKIAQQTNDSPHAADALTNSHLPTEQILVPVANPDTIRPLFELALLLKKNEQTADSIVYALSIVIESPTAEKEINQKRLLLQTAIQQLGTAGQSIKATTKIDNNISAGILRATYELSATEIILGWNDKENAANKIFGSITQILPQKTGKMILIPHLVFSLNTLQQIVVLMPKNAELEQGFVRWIRTLHNLAKQTAAGLRFWGHKSALDKAAYVVKNLKQYVSTYFTLHENYEQHLPQFAPDFNAGDLLVLITARPHSTSYNHHLDQVPHILIRHYAHINFILLYPEQADLTDNHQETIFAEMP